MKHRFVPKRIRTRLALLALAVVLVPYVSSRVQSPWRCVSVHESSAATNTTASRKNDRIRVVCYNIAHGRGLAEGNWDGGSAVERIKRLDQIGDLLRRTDADVVVLNEVDFDSSWSHGVNQAEYLARRAGYPYWVEQRNLDFRFLADKWQFGNAVLSRWPLEDAKVVDLPGYSWWETLLAGKKRAVQCAVAHPGARFLLIAAHLEHRSEPIRVRSAKLLAEIAKRSGVPVVLAGDLNSTPPGFPESAGTTPGGNAIGVLDASNRFRRSPETRPEANELTFPSPRPRMVIDWIMIPRAWRFDGYRVLSSELSDHRPVRADIKLRTREE